MTVKERNELLIRIDERLEALTKIQDQTLSQAMKTNGRVSALEKWKNYMVGGGLVILTIIGWLVQKA